jgi:hypothetical protein
MPPDSNRLSVLALAFAVGFVATTLARCCRRFGYREPR